MLEHRASPVAAPASTDAILDVPATPITEGENMVGMVIRLARSAAVDAGGVELEHQVAPGAVPGIVAALGGGAAPLLVGPRAGRALGGRAGDQDHLARRTQLLQHRAHAQEPSGPESPVSPTPSPTLDRAGVVTGSEPSGALL